MIDEARISNVALGPGQLLNAAPISASGELSAGGISQNSVVVNSFGSVLIALNSGTSNVGSLTMAGGQLDVTNNTLFVNYGVQPDPMALVGGYLASGYHGGAWDGSGIVSSTAAGGPVGVYGVGVADSADGVVTGQPANSLEIRYTAMADANLDGLVNSADALLMARNYLMATGNQWDRGDFNFDGVVDINDAKVLQKNYGATLPAVSAAVVSPRVTEEPVGVGGSADVVSSGTSGVGVVAMVTTGTNSSQETGGAGSAGVDPAPSSGMKTGAVPVAPPPVISATDSGGKPPHGKGNGNDAPLATSSGKAGKPQEVTMGRLSRFRQRKILWLRFSGQL